MSRAPETKHEKFLRLMQKRLTRTLEEMRLVGQLSSTNYERFPEEAEEAVQHLVDGVSKVADLFGVQFKAVVAVNAAPPVREIAVLSQERVKEAISHLDYGGISEALTILRKALPATTDA